MELNKETYKKLTGNELKSLPERAIQFGEGNFLRAFIDRKLTELNKIGAFNGNVIVVQPIKHGLVDILNEQDGLYTLIQRGIEKGKSIEHTEVINVISRGINPYTQWQDFLETATIPEMRFVFSNTTEAGIEYVKTDFQPEKCPNSFPAKLTMFLYERFKHFEGDKCKGVLIFPCELIDNNGKQLKASVENHVNDWNLEPEFSKWIEESCEFFTTLVDRIVPGFPKEEISVITEKLGYEDKLLDTCEVFHLWVIEGDLSFKAELPFEKAGLNVHWVKDLKPFRNLKVHILNGGHTMFTIPALLSGKKTVRETINDPVLFEYISMGLVKEVLPTIDLPEKEKASYLMSVLERFGNPYINHYLESIILNTISKFRVRLMPTILKYYKKTDKLPGLLLFSLSALIYYYCKALDDNSDGESEMVINDDKHLTDIFRECLKENKDDVERMVNALLSNIELWGMDLTDFNGFSEKINDGILSIKTKGITQSLIELTENNKL